MQSELTIEATKKLELQLKELLIVVKRRFPCLSMWLKVKLPRAAVIIVAAFVSHNIVINAADEIPERDDAVYGARRNPSTC
ncbi:hypothetical protein ANN_27780 [Periplaneta americana]|uniref:DDE Tnp4 domain-containing protein n=1 Tax=Periplaneta americana TaxID=6978 RepID=A0ABQ8RVA8_PERAM|nr:hypothetical protein ANN_27780 [Periplaneta americana]